MAKESTALMEPMLPAQGQRELEDLAMGLAKKGSSLAGALHPIVRNSIGDLVRSMGALAAELGIHLLLGSIPERVPRSPRTHNTSVLIGPGGDVFWPACERGSSGDWSCVGVPADAASVVILRSSEPVMVSYFPATGPLRAELLVVLKRAFEEHAVEGHVTLTHLTEVTLCDAV